MEEKEKFNPFEHGFHLECNGCKYYHPENINNDKPQCYKGYTGVDSYYAEDLDGNIVCGCWNWETNKK
jgi:hypothetical protein